MGGKVCIALGSYIASSPLNSGYSFPEEMKGGP